MSTKQKKILKEELQDYFEVAFERAQIGCNQIFINGKPYKKPKRGWYRILSSMVLNHYHPSNIQEVPLDYGQYLNGAYKRLQKALKNRHETHVGYYESEMKPFLAYVKQELGQSSSVVFSEVVFLAKKPYSFFNLWRSPKAGQLIKSPQTLIFQNHNTRETYSADRKVERAIMPPLRGEWIKVTDGPQISYLSVSDQQGNLKPVDSLLSFFKS